MRSDINKFALALTQARDSDPTIAKRGARVLNRGARGNWTAANKAWFTSPVVVGDLLDILSHSIPDVAVDIVGALGALSQRYDCLDRRIYEALIALFPNAHDLLRIEIAAALPQFGTDSAWQAILEALSARPPAAAQNAVGLAVGRYGQTIPVMMRALFASRLIGAAMHQKNNDVRSTLAKALQKVGRRENVPALLSLVDSSESEFVRDDLKETIRACESRDE